MKNVLTAEEFKKQILKERGRISEYDLMIEFAKYIKNIALEIVSIEATIDEKYGHEFVNQASILNAFPDELIK